MNRPSRVAEPQPSTDPLSALVEAAVGRALDARWDSLLEVVASRPAKVLLDPAGVCQLLGVTSQTVRKMRDDGMPFVRVGETYRYDGDAVLEWLRQRADGAR